MKKIIPLFLLFCLLLTACTDSSPPNAAPSTDATSNVSDSTDASTHRSEEPTTQTTPTDLQEFPMPSNTVSVATDFSHYYNSPVAAAKCTRLSDGSLTDLQPTENGLQIYPYVGKKCPFSYDYDITGNPIYTYIYGIVDETGCILVDPIYEQVTPLRNDSTDEVLPIWVLRKEHSSTGGTTGFAAMDGSFVIDCIYDGIYANDGRLIAFYPQVNWNGPIAFDVYDLSGKLLFTSKDLPLGDHLIGPPTNYTYAEGLYTIAYINAHSSGHTSGYHFYYINEDGHQVLGPYSNASAFTDGIAAVSPTIDTTVYIDKTGVVLPIPYVSRRTYPDGTYTVWEDITPESVVYGQATQITWYSPSGEVLWVREECSAIAPHLAFYSWAEHGQTYLENLRTSQTYTLPHEAGCYAVGNPSDPVIAVRYYDEEMRRYCTRYMTDNFQDIGVEMSEYDFPPIYEVGSVSQWCAVITDKGTSTVYMEGNAPHATFPVGTFTHFEGYPGKIGAFTTEQYTQLYTPEGELFFSYPVSYKDD